MRCLRARRGCPAIDVKKPAKVIGTGTVDNIQIGLYYGYIGLVDGILERMLERMQADRPPGAAVKMIATGGLARLIAGGSQLHREVDEMLTLTGLRMIYERNLERQQERAAAPGGLGALSRQPMQNYFNYFTEIEERFQQRRGSLLMLSTLDWALIETWREAGVPLEAVLRGIDDAFDKHDAQKLRAGGRQVRKVNGLAWAAQSVMAGGGGSGGCSDGDAGGAAARTKESGFEAERVRGCTWSETRRSIESTGHCGGERSRDCASWQRERRGDGAGRARPDADGARGEDVCGADGGGAGGGTGGAAGAGGAGAGTVPGQDGGGADSPGQQQFLQKRLLEARGLPRLSLFYMSHG